MRYARLRSAALGGTACALIAASAQAQVVGPAPVQDLGRELAAPEKVSVGQRNYAEYAPLGVRLGLFTLSPDLQLGSYFDDNIYGSGRNAKSDLVMLATPTLRLSSNWPVHYFGLYASGRVAQYRRYSNENVGDAIIQANGRLDIRHDQILTASVGYQLLHQPRYFRDAAGSNDPNNPNFGRYPVEYSLLLGRLSYLHRPGRLGWGVDLGATNYQFSNQRSLGGGTQVNSLRNRTDYSITPRVSYELVPGYQAFLQASANRREYRSEVDPTPLRLRRSSNGYSAAVGTEVNLGELVTGTVAGGYAQQFYDDNRLNSTTGPFFSAALLWNVSRQTSLRFGASRTIDESIISTAVGVWDTRVNATVEQEFAPNLIGTATVGEENLDYLRINLTDDIVSARTDLRYLASRNLSFGGGLEWRHRLSSQTGANFDQEIASVYVRLAE